MLSQSKDRAGEMRQQKNRGNALSEFLLLVKYKEIRYVVKLKQSCSVCKAILQKDFQENWPSSSAVTPREPHGLYIFMSPLLLFFLPISHFFSLPHSSPSCLPATSSSFPSLDRSPYSQYYRNTISIHSKVFGGFIFLQSYFYLKFIILYGVKFESIFFKFS